MSAGHNTSGAFVLLLSVRNFYFANIFKQNTENPSILMRLLTTIFSFASGKYSSIIRTASLSTMID